MAEPAIRANSSQKTVGITDSVSEGNVGRMPYAVPQGAHKYIEPVKADE